MAIKTKVLKVAHNDIQQLNIIAKRHGFTVNALCRFLLSEFLNDYNHNRFKLSVYKAIHYLQAQGKNKIQSATGKGQKGHRG